MPPWFLLIFAHSVCVQRLIFGQFLLRTATTTVIVTNGNTSTTGGNLLNNTSAAGVGGGVGTVGGTTNGLASTLAGTMASAAARHSGTKYSKLENAIDSPGHYSTLDSPSHRFLGESVSVQQRMLQSQDEQLDIISDSVGTLKTVSRQIGLELDEQAVYVQNLVKPAGQQIYEFYAIFFSECLMTSAMNWKRPNQNWTRP